MFPRKPSADELSAWEAEIRKTHSKPEAYAILGRTPRPVVEWRWECLKVLRTAIADLSVHDASYILNSVKEDINRSADKAAQGMTVDAVLAK